MEIVYHVVSKTENSGKVLNVHLDKYFVQPRSWGWTTLPSSLQRLFNWTKDYEKDLHPRYIFAYFQISIEYIVYQNLCLEDLCACSLAPKTSKISLASWLSWYMLKLHLCKAGADSYTCRSGNHPGKYGPLTILMSWKHWIWYHPNQELARNHVGQFSENQWC